MSHLVVNFCLRDPVGDCSRSTQYSLLVGRISERIVHFVKKAPD